MLKALADPKLRWFYLLSGLFILLNSLLLVKEFYWGIAIPVAIVVALMYLFWLDKLLLLIVLVTPLAVNIADSELGIGISLPSEPLMVGVLVLFILKTLFNGQYDRKILTHPLTIAVFFNLAWLLITSITSEMPLVSFKFLAARLWFVVPFYFLGILLFKDVKNISRFKWLYVATLIVVIIYTTVHHSSYGFAEKQGHWVMKPFYNDHTAYGAILAFFVPVFVGFIFNYERSRTYRLYAAIVSLILLGALYLSFSRAAWVSLAASVGVAVLVVYKIRFRWIFAGLVILIASFYMFKAEILYVLEKNKQDSSANFIEHVQSIYNISSDASNLERINRWQSAIRMFEERPVLGWGPGTYQFIYAPFQRSKERTIISTNAGDLGNAHSEYIGPLSEQGFPGLLSILWIGIAAIVTGIRVYRKARNREIRLYSLVSVLALVTYFIHGFLNNFLDTDKASVPFWGFMAMIVAMDIYHKNTDRVDTSMTKGQA
ncbi:O-antigen ligase [Lentimicrobium saccharophilum]|uniref:O-antigen ligase n=1 Tax=Lentimicrobium saccharophilum TaxID=1678841 RepID=A0A0S7BZK3_9BACT|nr:O-antigen ligase family protein [Lentimicrobium saccharophilum]GAP43121.1 O-antigen ligase [Lentimicrobium saccharophilum]